MTIKLLLVEDDRVDQLAFERMVAREDLPYEYQIAGSAREARELLANQTFDVVLLDYLLGDATGFEILPGISEQTPVIFTTGAGDEAVAVRAMKAGAADYLIKDQARNYLKVLPTVIQHTLHLLEAQRAVDDLREVMIHTMVHDLRNPLGAIYTSMTFMQEDTEVSGDQAQALKIAINNAEKMLQLINHILEVHQLESGRLPVEQAAVDFALLVDEVLAGQAPLAEEKDIRLAQTLPADLPPLWIDNHLIERVLQNLIGNALKFTPEGGRVTVDAERRGDDVRITVSDTGPGIPPEIQANLFQKFVSGRQQGSGHGLGLAFSKLAVEANGGEIWVESEPDHGATFTLTLPVAT